jgi:hypothetical protein
MIKSDKIREYFRKHPGADVAKVAAKFQASKPMTYKMRKQVQDEWNPPAMVPVPEVPRRTVTLSRSQALIAKNLGLPLDMFVKEGLKQGLLKYDEPEVDTEAPELGRKFDAGKLDYTLVPFEGLEEIIKVLMFGAQKYDRHNWKHVDNAQQRYTAAAFRHMAAHAKGEKNDPETGLSHLAHAGCCVLFLLALEQQEAP